jgi:hypothetical protein
MRFDFIMCMNNVWFNKRQTHEKISVQLNIPICNTNIFAEKENLLLYSAKILPCSLNLIIYDKIQKNVGIT